MMNNHLQIFIILAISCLSQETLAAPVTLDKTQTVAIARKDLGTGLCGSAINYRNMRINEIYEAVDLLNAPKTDPRILGRTSTLFANLNFRNNYAGSSGEFTSPDDIDAWLPFSSAPASMPQGNDFNIAFRLRGYLNITSTNGGQPIALGINCNDACSLRIGTSKKELLRADDDDAVLTGTRVRQVIFLDTGLYPIELIHFQNANEGFFECTRTNMPISGEGSSDGPPPGDAINTFDKSRWKIVASRDLFSSIADSSLGCQECGAPGMDCGTGNFCGDGLCQPCNVGAHCGPSCASCPGSAPICANDRCVECRTDEGCPPGLACVSGHCGPPLPCLSDDDCKPLGLLCDPVELVCRGAPIPCGSDTQCPAGQRCDGTACRFPGYFQSQDVCDPRPVCLPDTPCASGEGAMRQTRGRPHQRICGCAAGAFGSRSVPSRSAIGVALIALFLFAGRRLRRHATCR